MITSRKSSFIMSFQMEAVARTDQSKSISDFEAIKVSAHEESNCLENTPPLAGRRLLLNWKFHGPEPPLSTSFLWLLSAFSTYKLWQKYGLIIAKACEKVGPGKYVLPDAK